MFGIEPLSVGLLVTEAVGVVSVGPAVGFSLPGLVFVGRRVTDAVGVVSDGLSVEATALGLTVGFSLPGHLLAVGLRVTDAVGVDSVGSAVSGMRVGLSVGWRPDGLLLDGLRVIEQWELIQLAKLFLLEWEELRQGEVCQLVWKLEVEYQE